MTRIDRDRNEVGSVRDMLREDFEAQAEWRRNKAVEYPNDDRNSKAAEMFDKLAATVGAVPESLLDAYAATFSRWETSEVVTSHSEALREVGSRSAPADAAAFVRDFVERINPERRRFEALRGFRVLDGNRDDP
jgi:hypothetical protein